MFRKILSEITIQFNYPKAFPPIALLNDQPLQPFDLNQLLNANQNLAKAYTQLAESTPLHHISFSIIEDIYSKLLPTNRENNEIVFNLGVCNYYLEDYDTAELWFSRVIKDTKAHIHLRTAAEICYAKTLVLQGKNPDEIMNELNASIDLANIPMHPLFFAGEFFYNNNDHLTAIEIRPAAEYERIITNYYTEILSQDLNNNEITLSELQRLYTDKLLNSKNDAGKFWPLFYLSERSTQFCFQNSKISDNKFFYALQLANIYSHADMKESAIENFQTATSIKPLTSPYAEQFIQLLINHNRLDSALEIIEKYSQKKTIAEAQSYLFLKACVYERLANKNLTRRKQHLSTALKIINSIVDVTYNSDYCSKRDDLRTILERLDQ